MSGGSVEKLTRWAVRILAGLLLLAGILTTALFVLSELIISKPFEPIERTFTVPEDPESIAEGGRLARVRGCYDGCHGDGAGGSDFFGLAAPNLTKLVHDYSDSQLEASIRQGIRPDGASLFAMPSDAFSYMSDRDLGAIIAFLRSLPVSDNDPGARRFPVLIRAFGIFITYKLGLELKQAERATKAPPPADTPAEPMAHGRYLAFSICSECHGLDLFGQLQFPDLIVASAYSLEEFRDLMATGEAPGDRKLDLMALVAQKRFSHLADDEVQALHKFLTSDEFVGAERP